MQHTNTLQHKKRNTHREGEVSEWVNERDIEKPFLLHNNADLWFGIVLLLWRETPGMGMLKLCPRAQIDWSWSASSKIPQIRSEYCDARVRVRSMCGRRHCNTLQQTATVQHTATHCNTLQHTVTHCHTPQHIATHCVALQDSATQCTGVGSVWQEILQNTATHCNMLQHCSTPWQVYQSLAQRSKYVRVYIECIHVLCVYILCTHVLRQRAYSLCQCIMCCIVHDLQVYGTWLLHVGHGSRSLIMTHGSARTVTETATAYATVPWTSGLARTQAAVSLEETTR